MTADSRTALEAAALLDKAADRIDRYGLWTGSGYYAHGWLWWADGDVWIEGTTKPATERPAWGSTHILFAAGVEIPYWGVGPTDVPPVAREALELLATFLYARSGDDDRIEDADGYLDVDGQIEHFEAPRDLTISEVSETWRDCAKAIRAKHTTPAETKAEAA